MIHFPILRVKRFTTQLQELSIGQSIKLAGFTREQESIHFLAENAIETLIGTTTDINFMTVQERLFLLAHYLAFVSEDGPNFRLGDGLYSDYFDGEHDYEKDVIDLGELEGDQWRLTHLLSGSLLAIERVQGLIPGIDKKAYFWKLGAMACQLFRKDEDIPQAFDADYDDWLVNRIKIFDAFPEGDFLLLLTLYEQGLEGLHHLFRIDFDDKGLIVLPKEVDSGLSPARFRPRATVSRFAQAMAGQLDE